MNAAIDAAIATLGHNALDSASIEEAIRACQTGAPVGTLLSAMRTTVGEIRKPAARSDVLQIADAFPGQPDAAFAAWCRRSLSDGREQYYAVGPNDEVAVFQEPSNE